MVYYFISYGPEVTEMKNSADHNMTDVYAQKSLQQLEPECGGLTSRQAEEQRLRCGSNRTPNAAGDTLLHRIRRAFVNPFSLVLLVLACISLFVDVLFAPPAERNFTTAAIITVMLVISGCVRLLQELRSGKAADRLIRLVDSPVAVRRDRQWSRREAADLVVGDYVRLSAGERVPADIRITKLENCFFSEAGITGESETVSKSVEAMKDLPDSFRRYQNIAFGGSTVVCGAFEGIVTAVGTDTVYGWPVPDAPDRKRGFDRGANSIAWVLIRFMALLVPVVFVASGLTKGSWFSAFLFSLSVAVGLTPELLPMVITACLAKGSFNMSRKQTVVRNVNAMQGFGSMDVICVDKTGTLTQSSLLLEYYMDILGNEDDRVLDLAYLNSLYHSSIHNPLDAAILRTEQMPGRMPRCSSLVRDYVKLEELPFDYSRKIASVLVRGKDRCLVIAKGDPDSILSRCRYISYQDRQIPIDENPRQSVHAIVDEMQEDGMKVLAIAVRTVEQGERLRDSEDGLTLCGYIAFFDPPRETASSAIRRLTELNVDTKVLTGDSMDVTVSICRRLGLDTKNRMTGAELEGLTDNDVQVRIEQTSIFAELSPTQKAYIVSVLQSNGHAVGFLADGMNDLPAVLQADVGISVDTAVPAVKECADVLLLKKDLNVLESGITEGRRAFANMSKYVKITASSNLGNIFAIVLASIFLPVFPMTSVQLLLLNLLYDILCLVLPWDHVDPELYSRPMEWSGKNLSRFMLIFGPVSSLFDLLTFAFLFFWLCPASCGGSFYALTEAGREQFVALFQTGWFLESMWTQVLILHLLRTGKLTFLQSNSSRPVWIVTCLGIITFTLLAVTPAGSLIGMTALPPVYYLFLIAAVCGYLLIVSWVKQIYMKHHRTLI